MLNFVNNYKGLSNLKASTGVIIVIRYGTYLFSNANQKVQLGYFVTRLLDPDWSKATPNFVMMQVLSSDINQTLKHQSDYDLRIKSAN